MIISYYYILYLINLQLLISISLTTINSNNTSRNKYNNNINNSKINDYKSLVLHQPDDEEIGGHFEGDMILSSEQIDVVHGFRDRNGLLNIYQRWENNILPYEIDLLKYDKEHILQIYKAVRIIHKVSCIKLRPKVLTDIDYIYITVI